MPTTKKAPAKAGMSGRKPTTKKKAAPKQPATKTNASAMPRGRKPDAGSKSGKIRELLKSGMKPSDIAKQIGCTVGLVYNVRGRAGGAKKRRGPGRPKKSAPAITGLSDIVAAVRATEQETAAMRAALERIQAVIVDTLR